jgi:hypothetical protein
MKNKWNDYYQKVLMRVCRKGNPFTVLVGMQITATLQWFWKRIWRFLRKFYDPAIPLLVIQPKKMKSVCWRDFIPTFTAALFTLAKKWKPPKYELTDDWMKKIWYMHPWANYSAIKRTKYFVYSDLDWTGDYYLSEIS